MTQIVKRSLVRGFEVFGVLAVALNLLAVAESIQRDRWTMALAYFVIAASLATALAIHWYATHHQTPYVWRDERWGLERWREQSRGEADPDSVEDADPVEDLPLEERYERFWEDDRP